MSLEELKEKAVELSRNERIELIGALKKSLNDLELDREWQFLASRPHKWRKQLYIKNSRLPASAIWSDLIANNMTVEDAADNWNLPIAAIQEVLLYCELNKELLDFEADEEGRRLSAKKHLHDSSNKIN